LELFWGRCHLPSKTQGIFAHSPCNNWLKCLLFSKKKTTSQLFVDGLTTQRKSFTEIHQVAALINQMHNAQYL
jgi:hypothetical protein